MEEDAPEVVEPEAAVVDPEAAVVEPEAPEVVLTPAVEEPEAFDEDWPTQLLSPKNQANVNSYSKKLYILNILTRRTDGERRRADDGTGRVTEVERNGGTLVIKISQHILSDVSLLRTFCTPAAMSTFQVS